MNLLAIITLLLTLGSTVISGDELYEILQPKPEVLRRSVRAVVNNNFVKLITVLESKTKAACSDDIEKLEELYVDLKSCIGKKRLFITPKEEYITNIDKCSTEAVAESKNCLAEEQKYYPDLMISLVKSLANLFYDDLDILTAQYLDCIPKIKAPSTRKSYLNCVSETSKRNNATAGIRSKAMFCRTFISITMCYTDLIKDTCEQSAELDKFREDYVNANKRVCEE